MKKPRRSKLPEALRRTIDRYRRRRRLVRAQSGLFLTLLILVTSVGLALGLDRLLRLDPVPRIIFLAVIAVTSLWILITRVIRPAFRKMSDRRAASSLGRHFPEMREDLLSGVELSSIQDEKAEEGMSHSLIVSAVRHIAERASRIDPRLAVSIRPLLKIGGILLVAVLLFQVVYYFQREPIRNALRRLFQPTRSVEFFSYTKVHVEPGDHILRTGDIFELSITTTGRPAKVANLQARKKSGPLRKKLPFEEGIARWRSAPLFEEFTYRALAGDGISDWYTVRVVSPPALRSKSAVLYDPEYAGRQKRTLDKIQGPLQIVVGTGVELRVEPVIRGADEKLTCTAELVCPLDEAESAELQGKGVDGPITGTRSPWPELEAKLKEKISFDFTDTPFKEALASIEHTAEVAIVLDEAVAANIAEAEVTLKVAGMELAQALDWIVNMAGLKHTLKDGAIFISTEAGIAGEADPGAAEDVAEDDGRPRRRGVEEDEPPKMQRFAMIRKNGFLCSPLFTPTESGEYMVEMVDAYGLRNRSPQSVFITLVPDKVPVVVIKNPARDLVAMETEVIEVEMVADDELGLRGLDLTYRVGKGGPGERIWPGRRTRLPIKEGGIQLKHLAAKMKLNLAEFELTPGDVMEYRAEAADYADDPEMRRGVSPAYRITIITEEQHLIMALQRLRDVRIELLKRSHDQEQEAIVAGQMAESAQEDPVNKEARAAQDRETELARSVEGIARTVDLLTPDLLRNPSVSTALIAGLEKLGRAIRTVARGPMIATADKLGEVAATRARMPDRAVKQATTLKQVQKSGMEIAVQLKRLADEAARLQRSGALKDLADLAELLAARQWEVKDAALKVGVQTIGAGLDELSKDSKNAVHRLFASESAIHSGVNTLMADITKAISNLIHADAEHAAVARRAEKKLTADNISEVTAALAQNLKRNILFCELPRLEEVALSLDEVVKILTGTDAAQFETIATQLQEFIKRQIRINTNIITAGIYKKGTTHDSRMIGDTQKGLERDVLEQANALHWLAQEFDAFEMQTPRRLEAAAGEMKAVVSSLDGLDFPQGLEHGRKALALLMDARDTFAEELVQMGDEEWPAGMEMSLEGALLLLKILRAEKALVKATAAADEQARVDFDAFTDTVIKLAERQSAIRLDTGRLEKLLAGMPGAAPLIRAAGEKMDISRQALDSGDAGKETRVVQRQAIALLEQLLGDVMGMMGEMGLMGMRGLALIEAFAGGGFYGGANAPILPASTEEVDDDAWRIVRSRFEGQLSSDFDAKYPPRFRKLLEAYFARLRSEPRR